MVQHRRQPSTTHSLCFWDHLGVADVVGEGLLPTVAARCRALSLFHRHLPPFRRLRGQPVTRAGAELARG